MPFKHVAINDGRVAGAKLFRNLVIGLDLQKVFCLFSAYLKASCFQVLAPTLAAASARGLVDLDRRHVLFAANFDRRQDKAGCQYDCEN